MSVVKPDRVIFPILCREFVSHALKNLPRAGSPSDKMERWSRICRRLRSEEGFDIRTFSRRFLRSFSQKMERGGQYARQEHLLTVQESLSTEIPLKQALPFYRKVQSILGDEHQFLESAEIQIESVCEGYYLTTSYAVPSLCYKYLEENEGIEGDFVPGIRSEETNLFGVYPASLEGDNYLFTIHDRGLVQRVSMENRKSLSRAMTLVTDLLTEEEELSEKDRNTIEKALHTLKNW